MTLVPTFPQLGRLESEIRGILYNKLLPLNSNIRLLQGLVVDPAHRNRLLHQTGEVGNIIEDVCMSSLRVIQCASNLARVAQRATDLATARTGKLQKKRIRCKRKPKPEPPSQRTFRLFPLLPPELRIKIWEAAAEPPPCAHYFSHYDQDHVTHEPGAGFMKDTALWFTCRESRYQMFLLYRRAKRDYGRLADGHDVCDEDSCQLWRMVGQLNHDSTNFRDQMHTLTSRAEYAFGFLRTWVNTIKREGSTGRIKTLMDILSRGEGWRVGETEIPLQALHSMCANLSDEGLY
ncbi:hypothetical protein F503_02772 [Ophiostoma piceae UAMH 11346]|uniref:2EXR domain-containing protein n=1 Tax=Ophiostoma piceae (strain UAMH 11346) TaxID=1262450 RepID=S3CHW4_OPHP1|nr:hypothetical protein F503_02772 [Ophiostoma piceae UAMH 11346]